MSPLASILVIAKAPVPGRVKTRLCPPFTPDEAATLAAAAVCDTVRAADRVPAQRHLLVLDGDPDLVAVPLGWRTVAQVDGGLVSRLVGAFAAAGPGPSVLVGMDTPQLHPDQVNAFDPGRYDACLGPADDGGYWAIGFADPRRAVATIAGVQMSRADTGAVQFARLLADGLRVQLLDGLTDVDTAAAARAVAAQAPTTEFAETFRRLSAADERAAAAR